MSRPYVNDVLTMFFYNQRPLLFNHLLATLRAWNQEPNDYQGQEDCGVLKTDGHFNDVRCQDTKAAAVCEIDNTRKFNPLVTNGLSHPYHLDESIFIYRGIRSNIPF